MDDYQVYRDWWISDKIAAIMREGKSTEEAFLQLVRDLMKIENKELFNNEWLNKQTYQDSMIHLIKDLMDHAEQRLPDQRLPWH